MAKIENEKPNTDNVVKFKKETWLITGLVIAVLLVFIFIFSKFIFFRLDLTKGRKFSISRYSRDLVGKIEDKMIIRYYYNDNCAKDSNMSKIVQFVRDTLKDYERHSGGMIEVIIDELSVNNDRDKEKLDELEKIGFSYKTLSQSDQEGEAKFAQGLSGITINYAGQEQAVVGDIFSDGGLEYILDKEIKRILKIDQIKVGLFVGSEYRTLDNEYIYINRILKTEYSQAVELFPGENIPEDISIIMLIGIERMTEYDLFQIDQFLMRGGSLFIASSGINIAFTEQIQAAYPKDSPFFDMLKHYGITINRDIVGDNESYKAFPVQEGEPFRYPIWPVIISENINKKSPIVKYFKQLSFFWPSSIEIDEKIKNDTEILFKTTKKAWSKNDQMHLSPQLFTAEFEEGNKQFILGCAFNGKLDSYFKGKDIPKSNAPNMNFDKDKKDSGEARIIAVSNEVFLERGILESRLIGQSEIIFMVNAFDWLANDTSLIDIRDKGKFEMPLSKVSRVNKKQFQIRKNIIILMSTVIVPIMIIMLAVIINLFKFFQRKDMTFESLKNEVKGKIT